MLRYRSKSLKVEAARYDRPHGVTAQKTVIFKVIAIRNTKCFVDVIMNF
jgi:hypothetical protein